VADTTAQPEEVKSTRQVWKDMRAEGLSWCLHRIEWLMRLQALKTRPRGQRLLPYLGERQATAVAANLLERNFDASAPNRKWIVDFTDVWRAEGWLYVAAVTDMWLLLSISFPAALSTGR
jgi:putative transposase